MLFVLVMECFHALIKAADDRELFQPLGRDMIRFRASLYADDLVAFFSPVAQDLIIIREILSLFEKATCIATNYTKS